MPFTTIETELIDSMCPIVNQFKLAYKFQGLSSGFIPTTGAPDSEEVGIMSGGCYELSTVSSGIHKITSGDVAIGARITAVNLTSATTSYVLASSGSTNSLVTSGNVAKLEPGEYIDLYKASATAWLMINDTGDITSIQNNT